MGPVMYRPGLSNGHVQYRLLSSFFAVCTEPTPRQLMVFVDAATWTEAAFVLDLLLWFLRSSPGTE